MTRFDFTLITKGPQPRVFFTPVNLTKQQKLSINTIDFFGKVCYTGNKLENKTKILTNNKNKQRKTKMTQTIKLPTKVIDSDWKDDIDYEPYRKEKQYVSPKKVSKRTLAKIKNSPVKLTIRNMVNWKKIKNEFSF